MNIDNIKAEQLIMDSGGKFFHVSFTKKDGSSREMTARLGVEKYLAGGSLNYDPSSKHLVIVFDVEKKDYRAVNIDTINHLKINGVDYDVKKEN